VPKSKMTMEEILEALYQKAGELAEEEDAAELEQLATRPEFRKVIEVLLEEGRGNDQENTALSDVPQWFSKRKWGCHLCRFYPISQTCTTQLAGSRPYIPRVSGRVS